MKRKKKINIGSVKGIDEALAYLDKFLNAQKILDDLAEALIDEAREVAKQEYEGTGAILTVMHKPGEHTLFANGEEIAFIEFGAGMTTDGSGEFAKRAPFNVEEGSWSIAQAPPGEYAQTGFRFWHYNGKTYNAKLPHPGMEMARRYIDENAERRLKEAFGVD